MSSFWGAEVKPEKPYTHTYSSRRGRLRLTQATLGAEVGKVEKGKRNVVQVQCTLKNKEPVFLCALVPGQTETCHLDFEFDAKYVTFSVLGPGSVHLAGYYVGDVYDEDMGDSDTGSDSLQVSDDDFSGSDDDDLIIPVSHGEMSTGSEDDDSDYDLEDDEELMYQPRGKSSVVIEEIQEDDKPAGGEGQKGSNKKNRGENGDNSQLQLAVRTSRLAESLESEDEDGFPVSLSESKSAEISSKKSRNLNNEKSSEDRKRKSGAIGDHAESPGEANAGSDGVSKKKKKSKDKKTAVDSENAKKKENEGKQDSPVVPVDPKQKKKDSKNASASEADTDQRADKKNESLNDVEDTQGAKKKKNKKKKTQEKNASVQAQADPMQSDSKEQTSKPRTFANGLIIETVALGKPDGKKASRGKKVSVKYIGKLQKNGKIFDSTAGGRPFEFRLGIGQVIKGWDVGIDGMRVGDKRKLTIPPSMGYGGERAGTIPPNSTLVFDVELVNVK